MSEYEPVVVLQAANGEVTVTRRLTSDGGCEYFLEAAPTALAGEPETRFRVLRTGPYSSVEAALAIVGH